MGEDEHGEGTELFTYLPLRMALLIAASSSL